MRTLNLSGFAGDFTDDSLKSLITEDLFPSLEGLSLSNTLVDADGLTVLASLRQLERLDIGGCRHLSNDGFRALASHSATLTELDCTATLVDDQGIRALACCSGLTHLHLAHCTQISSRGLDALCNLTRLRDLNLSFCRVDDKGLAKISAS